MVKEDLWCAYCRGNDFTEHPDERHPDDAGYSSWECNACGAWFEDNPGYGYFASGWPREGNPDTAALFSPNTGEALDDRPPRTPEGIIRHLGPGLGEYLRRTQVK